MGRLALKLDDVRMSLYLEIEKANRTATSLIEQGYTRVHVQKCMPMLIASGVVFKYGHGKYSYYSIEKHEPTSPIIYTKKVNPLSIAEPFKKDPALAFRMGFTDIEPPKGRVHKGIMQP